jgi:hypothetical protein
MKKPRISFNKQSIVAFLVNHGEKLVAGLFALFACTLAWGGVEALRSMRPTQEQRPEAIVEQSKSTDTHIDSVKIAPDDELTSAQGLSALVKPWLGVKVDPPQQPLILNKPLFGELSKRTSPDILPIEDLRATAGVVVIATKPAPAGGRPAAGEKPTDLDAAATAKGPKPRAGGRGPQGAPGMQPGMPAMPPGSPEMSGSPAMPSDPAMGMNAAQAMGTPKLAPYVVLTGLIPVKKQLEEYDRRFLGASLRDPGIDTPRWNSYRIERSEVVPGAAEKWMPIDMKAVAKQYSAQWLRLQPEPALGPFMLSPEIELRDKTTLPIPFCSPLPQLVDGVWGFKGLHPWFVDMMVRDATARKEKEKAAREAVPDDVFSGAGQQPGMASMGDPAMMGSGAMSGSPMAMPDGAMGSGGMGSGSARQLIDGVEYRLFRFVDLSVLPGRKYRYRVRLVCWNPNLNLPTRHLEDVALAKKSTLESPVSDPTEPTIVPDGKQLLAMPLRKDFLRKLKPGMVPMMVLGEKPKSGTLALRALIGEYGGVANVDPKTEKKGDKRSFGDTLLTERVLLDTRGDRQDRAEVLQTTAAGKLPPPPEPLEMIFLRPDGTFEFASSAESQLQIDRYRATSPPELGLAPPQVPAGQPSGEPSPFGNVFGSPPGSQSR